MEQSVCFYQVYSSLDLSRGLLEEKGEAEGKKSESPLTLDSLSWTPDFAEMYVCLFILSAEAPDRNFTAHLCKCLHMRKRRPFSVTARAYKPVDELPKQTGGCFALVQWF